jgi:hypothetical protein
MCCSDVYRQPIVDANANFDRVIIEDTSEWLGEGVT